VLFVGDDWAEAHHDVEIEDETILVLARHRLPEGLAGITTLHELVAEHLDPTAEAEQVQGHRNRSSALGAGVVGGRLCVFAINRCSGPVSGTALPVGAKSDPSDPHLLAEIVRLDRAHHRRIAGDSQIAEHIKIATRAYQTMIDRGTQP
jgi:hypothetical protein